jgi:hypothetical protein
MVETADIVVDGVTMAGGATVVEMINAMGAAALVGDAMGTEMADATMAEIPEIVVDGAMTAGEVLLQVDPITQEMPETMDAAASNVAIATGAPTIAGAPVTATGAPAIAANNIPLY